MALILGPEGFLIKFQSTINGLSKLLGKDLSPGARHKNPFLQQAIISIQEYFNLGDEENCKYQLARLTWLEAKLNELEVYDKSLKNYFTKALNKTHDFQQFSSVRFELDITCSLFKKGIGFQKSESPDFLLVNKHHGLGIECTSIRSTKPIGEREVYSKFRDCLFKKSKKPYAVSNCILFIDCTNLFYQSNAMQFDINYQNLEEIIKEPKNRFPAIIIFSASFRKFTGVWSTDYKRFDSSELVLNMKEFLDEYYPFGHLEVRDYMIGQEG